MIHGTNTLRSCWLLPAFVGIFATNSVYASQSEHGKNYKGTAYPRWMVCKRFSEGARDARVPRPGLAVLWRDRAEILILPAGCADPEIAFCTR